MFILSKFSVIRTVRNTRGIEGAIYCFHVNQDLVLTGSTVLGGSTVLLGGSTTCSIRGVQVVLCFCEHVGMLIQGGGGGGLLRQSTRDHFLLFVLREFHS